MRIGTHARGAENPRARAARRLINLFYRNQKYSAAVDRFPEYTAVYGLSRTLEYTAVYTLESYAASTTVLYCTVLLITKK